ncbi:HD domain-containing protein [Alloprevotella tannerae]|uniref:HD domain-containing protein n=1 Tax=Alloprevotella tannerae TaxID=76122 RepID=UPI0028E73F7B|nr:HD domain-containing protein [Alloprevotella tannerae]
MNPLDIIYKYYPTDDALRRLLLKHSRQVADKALAVCERHPELQLDRQLVYEGAMLHDVGIFLTDAPGIFCHGSEPYLLHGRLGAELMRKEGREDLARICERHTGTGLTAEDIRRQGLPLPLEDFRPETEAEKVICYADKFFSKSHPDAEKTAAQVVKSLAKFGSESPAIFRAWDERYG